MVSLYRGRPENSPDGGERMLGVSVGSSIAMVP